MNSQLNDQLLAAIEKQFQDTETYFANDAHKVADEVENICENVAIKFSEYCERLTIEEAETILRLQNDDSVILNNTVVFKYFIDKIYYK